MGIFAILLLAVSLAIDCFTVSVTSGIILRRIRWNTFLTMAFFFGFFQQLITNRKLKDDDEKAEEKVIKPVEVHVERREHKKRPRKKS